jgi:demethylspheroidene O-methyltransferase
MRAMAASLVFRNSDDRAWGGGGPGGPASGPMQAPAPGGEPPPPRPGWRERFIAWRNRLLGSPAFHRFAADFPLTRPIARREARALFDILAGFAYSQTLSACVALDLFGLLSGGPMGADEIARRAGLPPEGALRLLKAAASLRLLEALPGGRFTLGPLGAAMRATPGVAAMMAHHRLLYADLADPVALLRGAGGGALSDFWAYVRAGDPSALQAGAVAEYSALMAASQEFVSGEVLDAYDFARHRTLLDVGGGEGGFLCAAAARAPQLQLMLFDLPAVADRARARFAAAGLETRAQAFGGDFLADPLPRGADVISLVRVAHDHDDASVLRLLGACRAALSPGGVLLIGEPMAATPGAEASGEAFFGLYLFAMGQGRPRTPAELSAMARAAGFARTRLARTRTPLNARLLVATA